MSVQLQFGAIYAGRFRTRQPSLQHVRGTAILTPLRELRSPEARGCGPQNSTFLSFKRTLKNKRFFSVPSEESASSLESEQGPLQCPSCQLGGGIARSLGTQGHMHAWPAGRSSASVRPLGEGPLPTDGARALRFPHCRLCLIRASNGHCSERS